MPAKNDVKIMSQYRRKKNKDLSKKIAEERIIILFELAEQNFKTHPDRTQRYVALARLKTYLYALPRPADA